MFAQATQQARAVMDTPALQPIGGMQALMMHPTEVELVRECFRWLFNDDDGDLKKRQGRVEMFADQVGEGPARDTAVLDLFNAYRRRGAATQLEMLHRFTDLCAETCRQREENETHSTQAIIKRINRYIEDNVENYDLSLTALARMTGFNPSYLSRFYRINTGKKLSDQIDEAKLQHAKKLIAQGELVKNVAERTGFASPSAFILFFKRNTGVTPRQYFESENKS